jgi:hypothetical protein
MVAVPFTVLIAILLAARFAQRKSAEDNQARLAGWASLADRILAEQSGVFEPIAWQAKQHDDMVKQVEAARKEEIAAGAACEADIQCIGERKPVSATYACKPMVERLAKNDFQWTDLWLEPKFGRFKWRDQAAGTITYVGDKVKYQNGFGAWTRYVYECDYNFRSENVNDVRAYPGQIDR